MAVVSNVVKKKKKNIQLHTFITLKSWHDKIKDLKEWMQHVRVLILCVFITLGAVLAVAAFSDFLAWICAWSFIFCETVITQLKLRLLKTHFIKAFSLSLRNTEYRLLPYLHDILLLYLFNGFPSVCPFDYKWSYLADFLKTLKN